MIEVYENPDEEIEIKFFGLIRLIRELEEELDRVPYIRYPNEYLRKEKVKSIQRELDQAEFELGIENNRKIFNN